MEVILKENYPSLGYVGDKVKVKRGFARNFLIPNGKAVEATTRNVAYLNHIVHGISAKRMKLKAQADEIAKNIEKIKLEFTLKAGEKGKSFGSVTVKDIETSLAAQGFVLDKKQIRLPDAIRKAGEFKAIVKLHSDVTVTLPVKVSVEAPVVRKEAAEEGDAKPKRTRSRKKAAAPTEDVATEAKAAE